MLLLIINLISEKDYSQIQKNGSGDMESTNNQRLKSPNAIPTRESHLMKENECKNMKDCKICKEQEVQCLLWDADPKIHDSNVDLYNPIRTLHFLISELKMKQGNNKVKKCFWPEKNNFE